MTLVRDFLRLLVLVVGALVAGLCLLSAPASAAMPTSVTSVHYFDARPAHWAGADTERGPPAAYDTRTAYGDDFPSRGAFAPTQPAETIAITTHATRTLPGQFTSATAAVTHVGSTNLAGHLAGRS